MLAFKFLFLHLAYLTICIATDLKNVYFIITAPTTTTRPVPILPQGYIHHSDIGTAYKIYTNRLNWTSATEVCSSEGGRIAVIDTPAKLEYIKNIRPWRNLVWTGIYRESRNHEWRTVHGGPISPDLPPIHHRPYITGNCVAITGLSSTTRLSVLSCDNTRRYVCEIPNDE